MMVPRAFLFFLFFLFKKIFFKKKNPFFSSVPSSNDGGDKNPFFFSSFAQSELMRALTLLEDSIPKDQSKQIDIKTS